MPPYAPHLYNSWMGNRFVVPPLGQYARPVYAEAVAPAAMADPALAMAVPQSVPMSGAPDVGFNGGVQTSAPGIGVNATSPSLGSFMGSIAMGPVSGLASVLGQSVINDIRGQPQREISRATIGGLMESLGFGRDTNFDPNTGVAKGRGPEPTVESAPLGAPDPQSGGNDPSYSPEAQAAAEAGGYEGSGMYAKGGKVNMLLGPNPPGPDDGYAGLDRGEYVIRKNAADHYGKGLLDALNARKIDKRKLRGLLE